MGGLLGRTMTLRICAIRHLSPACARNAAAEIRRFAPDMVLIEAPEDMEDVFTRPLAYPAALTAYSLDTPRRILRLPLADYSPELAAVRTCAELNIPWRCMDLPAGLWFGLPPGEEGESAFARFAAEANEPDFDDAWERLFEHDDQDFWRRTMDFGLTLRRRLFLSPASRHREAHMLAHMDRVRQEGCARLLCVCGAFHAPVLAGLEPAPPPLEALPPPAPTGYVLLPHSEQAMSRHAGYGGGCRHPGYFALLAQSPAEAAPRLLTRTARRLRSLGEQVSAADIQSALLLAAELAALRNGAVIWRDVRDAAGLCFPVPAALLAETLEEESVGNGQGAVHPEDAALTPLILDIREQLTAHRLDVSAPSRLSVQWDKPRHKTRSRILHQLRILGFSMVKLQLSEAGERRERWTLTPQPGWEGYALGLDGDSLRVAAALKLTESGGIRPADRLRQAEGLLLCGLPYGDALARWEEALVLQGDAHSLCRGALAVHHWGLRDDDAILAALQDRLFHRSIAALTPLLTDKDEEAATVLSQLAPILHNLAQASSGNTAHWCVCLRRWLGHPDLSPFALGLCLSLLWETGEEAEAEALRCFRRVFGGAVFDGAKFVGGLLSPGRLRALGSRSLWAVFDTWLTALNDEEFARCLPALRAAFHGLTSEERAGLAHRDAEQNVALPDGDLLRLLQGLTGGEG